jgi:hypothetical protein
MWDNSRHDEWVNPARAFIHPGGAMKKLPALQILLTAAIALSPGISASHAQTPDPAAVQAHVAAAAKAAGSDLLGPLTLCQSRKEGWIASSLRSSQ